MKSDLLKRLHDLEQTLSVEASISRDNKRDAMVCEEACAERAELIGETIAELQRLGHDTPEAERE